MSFTITESPLSAPASIADEYAEFWEEIGFDTFQDMVDALKHDTVDDFWETFGELRCTSFSPRLGEFAYVQIEHASENFALSLAIPFNRSGELSHCARLTLETRTRELQSHEFGWELSEVMLAEVGEDIEDFFANPPARTIDAAPELCAVDHRFLYPSHQIPAAAMH